MADNFLERRMADYQAHGGALLARHSAGRRDAKSSRRVFLFDGTTTEGQERVKALRAEGCRVAFSSADQKAGTALAQATGSQFHPLQAGDVEALKRSIAIIRRRWGGVDAVENCPEWAKEVWAQTVQ